MRYLIKKLMYRFLVLDNMKIILEGMKYIDITVKDTNKIKSYILLNISESLYKLSDMFFNFIYMHFQF